MSVTRKILKVCGVLHLCIYRLSSNFFFLFFSGMLGGNMENAEREREKTRN